MTAKREAELETENRMLREQVASLEKIIERMQPPVQVNTMPQPYYVPYPYGYWYYPAVPCTVTSGDLTSSQGGSAITIGGSAIQGSTTITY
jgi:hypothetical protein